MSYTFTPPTIDEAVAGGDRLSGRFRIPRGITLLKQGSSCTYIEVRYPTQDEMDAASVVYLGGYVYPVSDEEGACLISAGYSVDGTPDNPGGGGGGGGGGTTPSLGYGQGGYGEGTYGQ